MGERRGLEERPAGGTENWGEEKAGEECALVIGGAESDAALDCDRRCDREYGDLFRGLGNCEGCRSVEGSVSAALRGE